ncbi:MAG: branched-chain amino acid ABC transporter permease [Nitrospirota bacterium]
MNDMFLQQIINGLTIGSVYALIALGYTMVYGILQLINFAHGEIYMIGAYMGIIAIGFFVYLGLADISLTLTLILTFIAAMIFTGAYGITLERIAYRPMRNAPRLSILISAIGMSIFLQNYVMLAQGAKDKIFPHDLKIQGGLTIADAHITYIQIMIMLISILMMAGLTYFVKKTKIGMAMRATSQDMRMAGLLGINTDRIIVITFFLGSILAGAAGVMISMYYGIVNFSMGYAAGIKAFTAAVLGGIGNIPGAMLGGILLGLIEALGAGYISSEYKDVFAFAILVIVLIFRPSGLLDERVSEKV